MQYDISSIDKSADILSAVLRVYKQSNHVSYTMAAAYTVHNITEEWDQSVVSWDDGWSNPGGTFDPEALDTFAYDGTYNGWFEFDVTNTIKMKMEDQSSSFGLLMHCPGDPETGVSAANQESYFHSSESEAFDLRPHLLVTLDGTSVVPDSKKHLTVAGLYHIESRRLHLETVGTANLGIYSVKGQLLKEVHLSKGRNTIDLQPFAKGCYLFRVTGSLEEHSFISHIN